MKTIYVTVEEYKANKGMLAEGRTIYIIGEQGSLKEVGTYSRKSHVHPRTHIVINTHGKKAIMLITTAHVEIEVKPIYK